MLKGLLATSTGYAQNARRNSDAIPLPAIAEDGPISVETAISQRRSVRTFAQEAVSMEEVARVLKLPSDERAFGMMPVGRPDSD